MGCGTEAETNTGHRGAAIKLEKILAQYELIVKPCFSFCRCIVSIGHYSAEIALALRWFTDSASSEFVCAQAGKTHRRRPVV